ncbi:MBL fold metallo-hydrolase [Musicola keenii]|uniref:MBL fold metallo-hydrolase n=1 Tax=Musicola keenii TaxID=2884250 RepID=UPI001784FE57|nr:MBL fold metallo-hydrolase [Musicola keenii]
MPTLIAVSGVGGKSPAAFMVEVDGFRLMLDLGEGPRPGQLPDIGELPPPDAICLSHAHIDHCGGLILREAWGYPPVYATERVWRQIPATWVAEEDRRILPEHGRCEIGPVLMITGRSGHSPGGIWMHVVAGGGLTYTGDWSTESSLFPFDLPPEAALLITDASYGDRAQSLAEQKAIMLQACRDGALIGVPGWGRAPDMALYLMEYGVVPRLCSQVQQEISLLIDSQIPYLRQHLHHLLSHQSARPYRPDDVIICSDGTASSGLSAALRSQADRFHFIFSGQIPYSSPAMMMLQAGRARWLPWNVHPRLSDQLMLANLTHAHTVIPAFIEPHNASQIEEQLAGRVSWQTEHVF